MNPVTQALIRWIRLVNNPPGISAPVYEQDPEEKAERLAAAEAKRQRRQARNTKNSIAQAVGKLSR